MGRQHRQGLVLSTTPLLAGNVCADEPAPRRWPPRLLLNSDGGAPVFYRFNAPMTKGQLCTVVNDLPGTQVDVFMPCPQFSDDQFWYPTRIGEPYDGRHVKDGQYDDDDLRRVALNVRSNAERGIDPMQVWEERSHELGFLFIPSMRMNDVHKNHVDRWPSMRSHWEKERMHLLIGEAIPPWYPHPYEFTWAMDYAHEEVHQRKLDLIAEICAGYDVDGFEMDFLRSTLYFRHGKEAEGAKLMNTFVQAVRHRLDEIGGRKENQLKLLVRVPQFLDECEQIGLDVATWIRNGWVDMVIPMSPGYLDMDADIASFVGLTQGTDCLVAGGLEYYVRGYDDPAQSGIRWASIEMLRAAAASFWKQGASSIYLFNYDCHGPFPLCGEKRQAIQEIGDPAKLVGKDKLYLITVAMSRRTPEEGGNRQLPVELSSTKSPRSLYCHVADDLEAARRRGALPVAQMIVTASGPGQLRVHMNDREMEPSEQTDSQLIFSAPPVRQGTNQIDLHWADPLQEGSSRVTGVELWLRYP